ncbi:MAG: acyltransferase [Candidatus Xenobia bacterium]
MLLFTLLMYVLGGAVIGLSLFPGVCLCASIWHATAAWQEPSRLLALSLGIGLSYFIYGLSLIVVTAAVRLGMGLTLKPGEYPYMSLMVLRWVLSSGLSLIIRITFMDFILLTPFMNLYLRLMGCKVAPDAIVNSRELYDVSLITIESGAIIGGAAVLTGHLAEKGHMVFRPIRIGKKALVGSHTYIMPGTEIGDGAIIGAKALVLKDTVIPPHTVWGGVPAAQHEHHA